MYKAKKLIAIIVDDIKTNLDSGIEFTVENLFGKKVSNLDEMFTQVDAVYVVYNGATIRELTNVSEELDIRISFIVFEQLLGTQDKEAYLIDDLREFLTWHEFTGLATEYPTDEFDPFFPADEDLYAYDETTGRAIWVISGTIKYVKNVS